MKIDWLPVGFLAVAVVSCTLAGYVLGWLMVRDIAAGLLEDRGEEVASGTGLFIIHSGMTWRGAVVGMLVGLLGATVLGVHRWRARSGHRPSSVEE